MLRHFTFLLLFLGFGLHAQNAFDPAVQSIMNAKRFAGAAAVIVKDGKLAWEGYYGLANRADSIAVGPQTVFMLASISKTITAAALLHLYQAGAFGLDDPINDYLPFVVDVPNHPQTDITFRHLLTHTSGIEDNWNTLGNYYVEGDSPVALGTFLQSYLSPGGPVYSATANFYPTAPGTAYHYSNIGAALMGYLVEHISGVDFADYTREHLFEPLCMEQTGWFLADFPDTTVIAQPYTWSSAAGYEPYPHYGYPDYPDGQLRTTARSLARFMWMHMNAGAFDGESVLADTVVAQALTPQIPALDPGQGLTWFRLNTPSGAWWGHNGGDAGVATFMFFNPGQNYGVVLLTNSDSDPSQLFNLFAAVGDTIGTAGRPEMACTFSGVAEIASASRLSVAPNPATDFFMLEAPAAGWLEMMDAAGRIVTTARVENAGPVQVACAKWPAGMYFGVFRTEAGARYWVRMVREE